jgi:hypothetical protein
MAYQSLPLGGHETARASSRRYTACQEYIRFFDAARVPCSYEYCRDCLQDLFRASMTDNSLQSLYCSTSRRRSNSTRQIEHTALIPSARSSSAWRISRISRPLVRTAALLPASCAKPPAPWGTALLVQYYGKYCKLRMRTDGNAAIRIAGWSSSISRLSRLLSLLILKSR